MIFQTLEALTEYCRENKIIHIVNLKDKESGFAYVMTWDNDKNHYTEKKIKVPEVADHILNSSSPSPCKIQSGNVFSRQRSESQRRNSLVDISNGNQTVNLNFVVDEKLTSNRRNKYENQIRTQTAGIVGLFSSRATIEIVGVLLSEHKLKEIAINFNSNESVAGDIESGSNR